MKYFDWSEEKNAKLKLEREISFEEIVVAIEGDGLVDIFANTNKKLHPNQKIFAVNVDDYIYLVPFVDDEVKIFLKTIIPSRRATKKYIPKKGGRKK